MVKHIRDCRGRLDEVGYFLARAWMDDGVSLREIARRLRSSHTTVKRAASVPPPSARSKRSPPRPPPVKRRALTERRKAVKTLALHQGGDSHHIRQFPSCVAICREATRRGLFLASVSTVRRDLRALGFRARKRQRGPKRMAGDAARRVTFCKAHCALDGPPIWFSDENFFDSNDHGCLWQWCTPREAPQRKATSRWAPKVHVWGLIGCGVKELVFLPSGGVNQHVYKLHCLQRVLVPKLLQHNNIPWFMQDGARPHTAHATLRYLESKQVKVIKNWPPRSPDINPIEHLWARLQREVSDRGPADEEDLKVFVQEQWDSIPQREIEDLVSTFNLRCQNVVFHHGI